MPEIVDMIELASRYHKGGQLNLAAEVYRKIINSQPDHAGALHALGLIYHGQGDNEKAVEFVEKAIASNPSIPQFHNSCGVVLEAMGRFEAAIETYKRALELNSEYAEAHHNMAIALGAINQNGAAVDQCLQAISIRPHYGQAYNTMGFTLAKQGNIPEAIESFHQAIQLDPDFAESYNHLGVLLNSQGRCVEAMECFDKALSIADDYAEVHNNKAISLKALARFGEAVASCERAIDIEPGFVQAHYNLGNTFQSMGKCADAIRCYQQALKLSPDHAGIKWNLSFAQLLNGDLKEGWEGYKYRHDAGLGIATYHHSFDKARWDGEPFGGKRLLIHYEQGFGDCLQFIRYLPMVKRLGGTVILEVRKPMYELMLGIAGVDDVVLASTKGYSQEKFDLYAALMDLPRIFGTTLENIPSDTAYIFADKKKVTQWKAKLSGDLFNVGIVQAGYPAHENDMNRSCELKYFASLARVEGVKLYGLVVAPSEAQRAELEGCDFVEDIAGEIADFTDTAALMENLDLLISVDTAGLHLAGAMGKRVWGLIAYAPDWRWMLDRDDSPWYPTLRLFRQRKWGDWEGVFERVKVELEKLVATGESETEEG